MSSVDTSIVYEFEVNFSLLGILSVTHNQGQLHYLQNPVQNEKLAAFIQSLLVISRKQHWSEAWGPFEPGVLSQCPGSTPIKLAQNGVMTCISSPKTYVKWGMWANSVKQNFPGFVQYLHEESVTHRVCVFINILYIFYIFILGIHWKSGNWSFILLPCFLIESMSLTKFIM